MARVCVIRQEFSRTPRAAREVAALAADGHEVDYICLRGPGEPARLRDGRVTVWRLAVPGDDGGGVPRYLAAYGAFFVQAAALVTALHVRRRYALIQVNTLPDVLVFAAALPRLSGARVLLDLQECMPEFFATKFHTGPGDPVVKAIARLEQLSIRFADRVITPTVQLRDTFVGRGACPEKITVVMDGTDETTFRPLPSVRPDRERFTLISHGTVEERYGLDTAIEAVALLRTEIPELQLKIFGDGSDVARLRRLADERGVADRVSFSAGWAPFPELVHAIAGADVGVVAMKRDAFRDLTLAGKMFDFIAMGVPMVVSRTRSVLETFPPDAYEPFDSGSPEQLAEAVRRVYADPERRAALALRASAAAEPYRWAHQRETYLRVVDGLIRRTGGRSARRAAAERSLVPAG